MITDTKIREVVERRRKSRLVFRLHLAAYLSIVSLLWLLWAADITTQDIVWPIFPTLFWGVGLLLHYIGVRDEASLAEWRRELAIMQGMEEDRAKLRKMGITVVAEPVAEGQAYFASIGADGELEYEEERAQAPVQKSKNHLAK
jgi:hypothetical protein